MKRTGTLLLALFLGVCLAPHSGATVIPGNRTAPWQGNVGVPGGIPSRTTIYVNIVTDLGADPTGVVDCSGIIQNAINSCPAGQVVYIPPGRFRVGTQITLSNSKNNFTIRGAGMGLTTVFSASNNNLFLPVDCRCISLLPSFHVKQHSLLVTMDAFWFLRLCCIDVPRCWSISLAICT